MVDSSWEERQILTESVHLVESLLAATDHEREKKCYLQLYYRLLLLMAAIPDEACDDRYRSLTPMAAMIDQMVADADVRSPQGYSQLTNRILFACNSMLARSKGLAMET